MPKHICVNTASLWKWNKVELCFETATGKRGQEIKHTIEKHIKTLFYKTISKTKGLKPTILFQAIEIDKKTKKGKNGNTKQLKHLNTTHGYKRAIFKIPCKTDKKRKLVPKSIYGFTNSKQKSTNKHTHKFNFSMNTIDPQINIFPYLSAGW